MKKKPSLIIFAIVTFSTSFLTGSEATAQTAQDWDRDVDLLVRKVEQYHPQPWARISRQAFLEQAETIKAGLRDWDKEKTVLEIKALVASLRDGHTEVLLGGQEMFNLWFPVRMEKFYDGIFITASDVPNARLLGAQVLRLGRLDTTAAVERLSTVISSDSGQGTARLLPDYLSNAVILEKLGIIDTRRSLPLEVRLPDGSKETITVACAKWRPTFNFFYYKTRVPTQNETRSVWSGRENALPLYLSKIIPSRSLYWFEYLPEEKILYFQYNNVLDGRQEPFKEFTARLFRAYDERLQEIEKFVIDVRFNPGGNGYLLPSLVREFILRGDSLTRGKLFIITGKDTYSAASNFIGRMLKDTAAITVGDIASGPLNWCSDVYDFILPNSGLRVQISTMFWQQGHATDTRGFYPPQVYIPASFAQYSAGADPVLDAIRSGSVVSLLDALQSKGLDAFRAEYARQQGLYGPPEQWFPYLSFELAFFAFYSLLPAGKTNEALEILKLNTVLHPDDIRAWDLRAKALDDSDRIKEALDCYGQALSLEPHISDARSGYSRLVLLDAYLERGLEAMTRSFESLKKNYPLEVHEGLLNNLGYYFLNKERLEDAVRVFKLNVELHPGYANGYDSLGEAYLKAGDKELAIKTYQRAVDLDPANQNAKAALEKLRKS